MWFCYIVGLTLGMFASYGLGRAKAGDMLSLLLGVAVAIFAPFFLAALFHIHG